MKRSALIISVVVYTMLTACPMSPPIIPVSNDINSVISGLSVLPDMDVSNYCLTADQSDPNAPWPDNVIGSNFFVYHVHADRVLTQEVCLSADPNNLWVGAIIDASQIGNGKLNLINVARSPLDFHTTLTVTGDNFRSMLNASAGKYSAQLNDILNHVTNKTESKSVTYELTEIKNENQIGQACGIGLGVEGSAVLSDFKARFIANKDQKLSRFIVRVMQEYYSSWMDTPVSPSGLMDSSVTGEQFNAAVAGGYCPVYISKIVYGRLAYVYFESTNSAAVLSEAIEAWVKNGVTSLMVQLSTAHQQVLDNASISSYIYGGSVKYQGSDKVGQYGYLTWVTNRDASGVDSVYSESDPIAYEMRYLKNNQLASVHFPVEFYYVDWTKGALKKVQFNMNTAGKVFINGAMVVNSVIGGCYFLNLDDYCLTDQMTVSMSGSSSYGEYLHNWSISYSGSRNLLLSELMAMPDGNFPVSLNVTRVDTNVIPSPMIPPTVTTSNYTMVSTFISITNTTN